MRGIYSLLLMCFLVTTISAQQWPDDSFKPEIENPAYPEGKGPVVLLDEAHNNFHTTSGRYRPFVKLLNRDGYVVKGSKGKIDKNLLTECTIFAISVPMSDDNASAYSGDEIRILYDWVEGGGSLLLITDHFPDPPAIAQLAGAFGIELNNGYVLNEDPNESRGPIFFRRNDGTLTEHPITLGRSGLNEEIRSVTSFTGCAFKAGNDFQPLMIFGPMKVSWMTKEQDKFPPDTPKLDVRGWYQGGIMEPEKGRLAFFGEAGMFTAQFISRNRIPFGMNVPEAKENAQFLLNVMHWLSRIL